MDDLPSDLARAMALAMWEKYKLPVSDRFWSKVEQKGPDECWEWKGWKNNKGYGVFDLEHSHHNKAGVRVLASRMAWQYTNGFIPQNRYVLHKCDNPPCVNPSHLYLGSLKDNMRDRRERRRNNNGQAKLTPEQVREIRAKYKRGEYGYIRLAKEYNVGPSTIHDLIVGKNWKQVQ